MTPQSIYAYIFATVFALSLAFDVLFAFGDYIVGRIEERRRR